MRLIPEQYECLRTEIGIREEYRDSLIKSKTGRVAECYAGQTGDNDREIIDKISQENVIIDHLKGILERGVVVTDASDTEVGLGTEFDLLVTVRKGRVREITGVLVEETIGIEPIGEKLFVSMDSPLGEAILGRAAGEDFTYQAKNGMMHAATITALKASAIEGKGIKKAMK